MEAALDAILATASPFDDVFDPECLDVGERLQPLLVWSEGGRRLDLIARTFGWQVRSLCAVIDDVQATWNGQDAAAWECDASYH